MRAVVQRVHGARCVVEENIVSEINKGLIVFVGVCDDDTEDDVKKLANKLCGLRVFKDENGKLSLAPSAVGGSVMVISNFVLAGRVTRGFRPDCTHAAAYEEGKRLYELLISLISEKLPVASGVFGAHMDITVENDGPINVIIDTKELRNTK